MASKIEGYVTEIGYTHGYYRELSPRFLDFCRLSGGWAPHPRRPLRYLELGFGQGLSLNIHAAACPGEYWGADINPAHAAEAQELAVAAGTGARIFDQSFSDLCERDDLPEFDIITLHGIWSWVSDEARGQIVDLVRRNLAVGGAVYVSYNCTPGWSPNMPLRHLLATYAELGGVQGDGLAQKIGDALGFARKVADAGSRYFMAVPQARERLTALEGQNRNYLAHEYFNDHWEPMAFAELAAAFRVGKVDFAISANPLDHIGVLNFTPEGQALMAATAHPVLRETVRDFLVNQQFRKDVFIKGQRPAPPHDILQKFKRQGFALLTPASNVPLTLVAVTGEVALQEVIYRPVLDALAADRYRPKTCSEICETPALVETPVPQVIQALVVLTGMGHVAPVQDEADIAAGRTGCVALNDHLLRRALNGGDIGHLASPVLGGGIGVGRIEQIFLSARRQGLTSSEDLARFAWDVLSTRGQLMMRDGETLQSADQNLAELQRQAAEILQDRWDILAALEVV